MNKKMMMVALAGLMLHCGAAFGVNVQVALQGEGHINIEIDGSKTILDLKRMLFKNPLTKQARKENKNYQLWDIVSFGPPFSNSQAIKSINKLNRNFVLIIHPAKKFEKIIDDFDNIFLVSFSDINKVLYAIKQVPDYKVNLYKGILRSIEEKRKDLEKKLQEMQKVEEIMNKIMKKRKITMD